MSAPLFVYGTLCDPDLLSGVLGRSTMVGVAASAPGFAALHYPGRIYPALVRKPGAAAAGRVLLDLSPFEFDLLDAFEGGEYQRGIVPVMIEEELHEAFAYLPTTAIGQDAQPWALLDWQATHKSKVLAGERATADELRLKLLAIRPN